MQLGTANPYTHSVKEYVHRAMSSKYTNEVDETISRVCHSLITKKDAEQFLRLLNEMYATGYMKAIESAQKSLEAHGLKMRLVPPQR